MQSTFCRVAAALAVGIILFAWVSWSSADADEPFNLQDCESECSLAYGGTEWSPPALGRSEAIGYSNCILACQRKYWKQFDKDTERSDK